MTEAEIRGMQEGGVVRPGARRKRSPLVQTPVMFDQAERAALDTIAEEMGKSRSALIREAVQRVWLKGKGRKI